MRRELVDEYLRRLGVMGGAPDLELLFALHRAHAERVPYENLEIWLGRPTTVDPVESARRIVRGRGGYCYHLNGAFSGLVKALGFRVGLHVGGVQGNAEQQAGARGTHLVLTVSGLPAPQAPEGRWLVDLGMGDGIHEPLPLVPGKYLQGGFAYALSPSVAESGGWRFDHDKSGSFLGMDFRDGAASIGDFAAMHRTLSTDPSSGFVRTLTFQRRDATGADVLRGLELTRKGAGATRTTLTGRADWFAALGDVFALNLTDVSPSERDTLWRRVQTSHELWLAARNGN